MRFAISQEAAALRDVVREVLAAEVTNEVLRTSAVNGAAVDAVCGVWAKLAATGMVGTLVPTALGGLGLDENALVPMLAEIGYSGLAVPAAETIAVAAPLIAAHPAGGVLETMIAVPDEPGGLVAYWDRASTFVMMHDDFFEVYEKPALTFEPVAAVDVARPMARVTSAAGGARYGGDGARAWRRGALGTAALLTGLARRMLDLTVRYVQRREQFGVPVGSFQAVKHKLADALVAVEFAEPAVLAAGWAQAAGESDAELRTSAAKALASDAARLVARTAIQCHGAMGYTTEYELHIFAKRAWALASSWGTPEWHRTRVATLTGVNL